jgi:osmotically-inducible protein OsmY
MTMTRPGSTTAGRTDAEIFAEVRNALDTRPTVPATVRVHVDKGIVTLTGTVRVAAERAEAARVVRQVTGVLRVVNGISVGEPPSDEGFEPPNG